MIKNVSNLHDISEKSENKKN